MAGKRRFSGQRFRRSLRHFVLGRGVQAIATLGVTLLAIRAVGGTDYGVYMVIWGFVEILGPLTSLGLLPAVQRYLPELVEHGSATSIRRFVAPMMAARMTFVLAGSLALGLQWPAIAAWMGQAEVLPAQGWLAAAIVFCVLLSRFSAEMLECLLEQKASQLTRALLPLLRVAGLASLMATNSTTLPLLLWVDITAAAAAMLTGEVLLMRSLRGLHPDGSYAVPKRELLNYVWHLSAAQILGAASSPGTLRLIVARLLGAEAAGHFAFLQQLAITAKRYLPSVLFANLVRPMMISRADGSERAMVGTGLGLLWKINVSLVWPLVPAMVLIGQPAILTLSGGRIQESGWVIAILLAGLAAQAQSQTITLAMQVYKLSASIRNMNLVSLLAIPAVAWGADWGMFGVFTGLALVLTVKNVLGLSILRGRALAMDIDRRGTAALLAAIVLASILAFAALPFTGPWVAATVMLGSYLVTLLLMPPLSPTEGALIDRSVGRPIVHRLRLARRVRP